MSDQQIENIYPLTALQQGILFHSISAPDSGVFIDQIYFDVQLNDEQVSMFKRSWNHLIDRHGVLRTAIIWKDIKQPVQVVKTDCEPDWQFHDYSMLASDMQIDRFGQLLAADRYTDFDLTRPPLSRHHFIRIKDGHYRVLWTFHHLVLDGWSVANLFTELQVIFADLSGGQKPDLPAVRPFSDFTDYLQNKNSTDDEQFWRNYLAGYNQPAGFMNTGADLNLSVPMILSEQDITFTPQENELIHEFARTHRLSLNTLVHAAWSLLLMTYSGADDVVYGATFSGRDPQLKGIEKMIGVFINSLPVRVARRDNETVGQWLKALQQNLNRLKDYEHCALTDIKRCSDCQAQSSLFDCLLVVENYPLDSSAVHDQMLRFERVTHKEQSNYPCALLLLPGSTIAFRLIYDSNLFDASSVRDMLEQLHFGLLQLCHSAQDRLRDMTMLSPASQQRLLYSTTASDQSVVFESTVVDNIQSFSDSENTAITASYGSVSYAQLNRFVDRLAALIVEKVAASDCADGADHCVNGEYAPVVIFLSRDQPVVECMLSVLRSAMPYVVVDPDFPAQRIEDQIDDSKPVLCITNSQIQIADPFAEIERLYIDQLDLYSAAQNSNQTSLTLPSMDSLAYILYTSGSTGRPKGVKISHANLAYSTRVRSVVYDRDPAVFLLLSPYVFDSSVAGIYWTLSTGGRLIISTPRLEQDLTALIDQIYEFKVSHTLCLPSLFAIILDHARVTDSAWKLASLSTVILAGEPLSSPGLLELRRELLPDAKLYNEYGPTEATVWCSVYDASDHPGDAPVPIGTAIPGSKIVIVDQFNRLLPVGVSGEICVAGPGVSSGYLHDGHLDDKQFVNLDGADGLLPAETSRFYRTGDLGRIDKHGMLTYLGRKDDQIKIRGHRLQPAEIEQALCSSPLINDAVAFAVELTPADCSDPVDELTEHQLDQYLLNELTKLSMDQAQDLINEVLSSAPETNRPG